MSNVKLRSRTDHGSTNYALVKGKAYTFSLKWVATNLDEGPDYDWQAKINDSTAEGAREGLYGTGAFVVEDPGDLLTGYTDGGSNNRVGVFCVIIWAVRKGYDLLK